MMQIDLINRIFLILAVALSLLAIGKLVLNSLCLVPVTRRERVLADEYNKKLYALALIGILILGLAIRLWKFGLVPGGINQDEAMAAVDGKALADYATDRFGTFLPSHLYGWGYGQMSALLSYLTALFVKAGGLTIVTARLPLLTVSVAGGIFFYLFVKDLFGKEAAIVAAVFVAINPWHYVQSRWSMDCNLLPHLFVIGMYFLNRGLCRVDRKKKWFLSASMVFFGLCMYSYGVALYTIPPLLLAIAVYYLIRKKLKISDILLCILVYLLVSWPFLLTMAVNYFRWETIRLPFVTIPFFPESQRSQDILFFSENPLQALKENVQYLLNASIFQKKDLIWNDVEGFGTMYLYSMVFLLPGVIGFIRKQSSGMKGLAVFMVAAGVWVGICTKHVNVNRVNLIYYGIMIFIVLGISFTIRQFSSFLWIHGAMYAVMAVLLLHTYFGSYAEEVRIQFYDGFGQALMTAEQAGTDILYITDNTQQKGKYQVSEILTMFYDGTDAQYFQGKTNENKGKEYLPYHERFRYVTISKKLARRTRKRNAAYVVRSEDTGYFSKKKFDIVTFDRYSAVVPKK